MAVDEVPAKLVGDRYGRIARLALPIVGGMMSQNVLNLVDTWMVGRLGSTALAAVGTGGMVNFLAQASLMGLSVGVQTLAARRHGAQQHATSAVPLNAALMLALGVGLLLTLLLESLTAPIFSFINSEASVVAIGAPYLGARLWALVPAGLNFAFRGFWNGTNQSRRYLLALLVMHTTNIFLNWLFIFGNLGVPPLGAVGAGVASALATAIGTLVYFALALGFALPNGFLSRRPPWTLSVNVLRLALPTSLQQVLFAAGLTALFGIIGQLGTQQTAAAGVLINVMLIAILPGLALGIAATSLVSQALGAANPESAEVWGFQVAGLAAGVAAFIALPMLIAPDWFLRAFLTDPIAIALARAPLRVFAASIVLDSTGTVFQQALLGAGANRRVMLVSVACQWGVFLPAAYVCGPLLGFGLLGIWIAQAAYRVLQALIYTTMWRQRRWQEISV